MQTLPIICLLLALSGPLFVSATIADDEKECADQMASMAACIPYVSGSAKMPTKECCTDTDKVRAANPKCLCVLIKESTDPSIGLPINTTLALQMPAACKSDAKISDCPKLLNLPADSADAKIFKVPTDSTTTSPSDHSSASTKTPSSSSSSSSTPATSDTKATTSTTSSGAKIANSILLVMGVVTISLSFY